MIAKHVVQCVSRSAKVILSKPVTHTKILSRPCIATRLASTLKFSEKHEWVKVDGKEATIGITNYAQEALGEIVYVQLPEADSEVGAGEECGAVESVKSASDVYSPISGKVLETNQLLEETPATINKDPMGDGWLYKLEMSSEEEVNQLMDEPAYESFLKSVKDE